jgi:hypothetical protein
MIPAVPFIVYQTASCLKFADTMLHSKTESPITASFSNSINYHNLLEVMRQDSDVDHIRPSSAEVSMGP